MLRTTSVFVAFATMTLTMLPNIVLAQESDDDQPFRSSTDQRSSEILHECIVAMGGMALDDAVNLVAKGNHLITIRDSNSDTDSIHESTLTVSGLRYHDALVSGHFTNDRFSNGTSTWYFHNGKPSSFNAVASKPADLIPWPSCVLSWQDRNQIVYVGEATIEEQKFWKLKFTQADGHQSFRFFNQTTSLPERVEYSLDEKENPGAVATFEFSQKNRIQLPLEIRDTIQLDEGKKRINFHVFQEVEFDPEIDEEVFEIPAEFRD